MHRRADAYLVITRAGDGYGVWKREAGDRTAVRLGVFADLQEAQRSCPVRWEPGRSDAIVACAVVERGAPSG